MLKKYFTLLLINSMCLVAITQVTGDWHQTGPIAFPTNISGQIHGIGRTTQIKWDPIDDNTIWATTASGGLYVSHDLGVNWTVTGTDALPPLNCASVCIDFTDNNIIYLGTGDPNYYYNSYGVYKSTDGGDTWAPSNIGIGTRMALELLMKPDDHNTLIAATTDGIFKTIDGGLLWTEQKSDGAFTDMIFNPDNNGIIYAVDYDGKYFRSENWGDSWTDLSSEIIIPGGLAYGTRLGVSAADPNVVYIATIAGQTSIFKSTDAGLNFDMIKTDYPNLNGYSALEGGQGNYNFDMVVDPDDANKVYTACHVIWKSIDGGLTWTQYTDWWADCHTDMHHLVFNPNDHTMILNANDGGIFLSYDEGDTWTEYANGLSATEIYHAAQSKLDHTIVSIGTQDNGELYYGDPTWYCNRGGDWGARMWFDYLTYNRVYYYNGNRRVVTGGDQNWNSPIADPDAGSVRMAFTPAEPQTGFVTQYEVWRSDNLESASPDWIALTAMNKEVKGIAVSPVDANNVYVVRADSKIMHTTNAMDATPTWVTTTAPAGTSFRAGLAVSKYDGNVAYLFSYGYVYRTDDGAATWTNITYDLPGGNIVGIYLDDYSTDESIYVASPVGVFYHNITMDHWDNYSTGLPTVANIQDLMMYNDGSPNSVLRVGYYGKGVWESPLYQPFPIPAAAFTSDINVVCPGTSVQFTDASTDNTESILWEFEGGTPATSTSENPVIFYNTPGTYNVTLTASNINGSDAEIKTSYITVSAINDIPLEEGFQTAFPPYQWTENDANDDGVFWYQTSAAGGYDMSTKSMLFDNYYNETAGAKDDMVTPQYDFSLALSAQLTFDHAYAKWSDGYPDSLAVLITTNCGDTWTTLWVKSGNDLATAPDYTADLWVPAADQWRTDTIDLTAYLGEEKVAFAFRNIGHYGQGIYVDNINITGEVAQSISEIETIPFVIYPNPANEIVTIDLTTQKNIPLTIHIVNILGEIVLSKEINTYSGAQQTTSLDIKKLAAGTYIIQLTDGENILGEKKLVKM